MDNDREHAGHGPGDGSLAPYYCHSRRELLVYVPEATQRVLDVGCGAGVFGFTLKQRGTPEVHGIELDEAAGRQARELLDGVVVGDVETMELPFDDGYFNCIVFADLLEHLYDPTAVLRKVARVLRPGGLMVMSIPNIRFYLTFAMLAAGRWKYEDAGIMDRTHIRFFTAVEMRNMVRAAGLRVSRMRPLTASTPELLPRNPDGSVTMGNLTLTPQNEMDYLDLLTIQYVILATRPQPRAEG